MHRSTQKATAWTTSGRESREGTAVEETGESSAVCTLYVAPVASIITHLSPDILDTAKQQPSYQTAVVVERVNTTFPPAARNNLL